MVTEIQQQGYRQVFSVHFFNQKIPQEHCIFAYESIYHWKGNYIVLILVKILLKNISYFRCY